MELNKLIFKVLKTDFMLAENGKPVPRLVHCRLDLNPMPHVWAVEKGFMLNDNFNSNHFMTNVRKGFQHFKQRDIGIPIKRREENLRRIRN
jgi:hypothetical protein